MIGKPSLLLLTAGAAGIAALANAATLAAPPEPTRLGASIGQDLAKRDKQSAQRGRQLDIREQAARAAETRLKVVAATAVPTAPGAVAGQPPADPQAERFDELARIYQAMKPKAAAIVLEQLSMEVQVAVAGRMRERSTAMVMAAMSPKAAAALTMAMAKRGAAGPGWTAAPVAK